MAKMMRAPKGNTPHGTSPRAGKRTTKTKAKTARACGQNFIPTKSWRKRKQTGDY